MLVLMVIAIAGVSQLIVMDKYVELDEQQALEDAVWMRNLIDSDLDSLMFINLNYAEWDDTYNFIVYRNKKYVESNLVSETFVYNRLDFIIYLDSSGEIVHGSLYDRANDEMLPLSANFEELVRSSSYDMDGLVKLPEGLFLISSNPILTSESYGPSRGTLIMGRLFDSNEMGYLTEGTSISIELLPPDDPQLPSGLWGEGSSDIVTDNIDQDSIAGYYSMNDVFGNPVVVAKTTTPRMMAQEWQSSVFYYTLALLFVGFVFGLLVIFFLDQVVLKRLIKLCIDAKTIGNDKDFSSRLYVGGDDEISRLSDSINLMLGKLEDMHRAENIAVMKAMPVMIAHMKLDGTIIHRNDPQNGDLSLLSSMKFNNIYDILPKDTGKIMRAKVKSIANSNEVEMLEYNLPAGDRIVNLEARFLVLGKDDVLIVITDNSHRKAAEVALVQAKLEAEAANRSKSEFIANMSHELRTPLNSILGFSNVINKEMYGPLNESQKKYISNVIRSGNHLLGLINDVLSVSKIEAGKMELHVDEFMVFDAINEVETMMGPIAFEKGIDLRSDIDIEAHIKADQIKFKQIIYNLVSNAIKFSDNGGTVSIDGNMSENFMHISVKDRGIGISSENQEKLFQPFYQVDSSICRKVGGTGLGLVIVKKYTEMHGGYVRVESKEGEGSTFTVSLPFDGAIGNIPEQ